MPMSNGNKTKENDLSEAAEALVRAAVSHTENTAIVQGRETVKNLETISQSLSVMKNNSQLNMDTVSKKISEIKESNDDKLNSIQQKLCDLEKQRSIQFAIDHTDHESFMYYEGSENYYHNSKKSSDLVKNILWLFLKGNGYYLPDNAILNPRQAYNYTKDQKESDNQAFRDSVVDHLHSLLGRKPKLTKESNGRYSVWYS